MSRACNARNSTLVPSQGITCGRRERGADAGNGRRNPSRPAIATVEGTLLLGTPTTFAGFRQNVDLGRSDKAAMGLVPWQAVAPTTEGVLWNNEEGNAVSVRQAHALDVVARSPRPRARGHVLRSVQRPVQRLSLLGARAPSRRAIVSASRSGKPASAGGTGTGALAIGHARLAARHRSLGDQRGRA